LGVRVLGWGLRI